MTRRAPPANADERLDALAALFPGVVVEVDDGRGGKKRVVDVEQLARAVGGSAGGAASAPRVYLDWPGKQAALAQADAPTTKTLRPATSALVDGAGHALVVGDNLDALKLLRPTLAERVRLVLIDPPYNTGRDFIYRDRFTADATADVTGDDVDDATRRRAGWLSMIAPRLRLARDLLTDDGVLVVHIDEHELESLVLLGREIFGEQQHLGTIVWDKGNPKGDAHGVAVQHESIVVFARNAARCPPLSRPKENAERMLAAARAACTKAVHLDDARAAYAAWVKGAAGLSAGEAMYHRLDDDGRVYRLVSMAWPSRKRAPDGYFEPLVHPTTKLPCPVPARGWRNPPATMQRLLRQGLIEFGADHTVQPQRRYFLDENLTEPVPSIVRHAGSDDELLRSLGVPFDHPKPLALTMNLVRWFSRPGDVVVDFFAGAATTAHAVLALNAQTPARPQRRFVLVQRAEPCRDDGAHGFATIADVARARITRAGERLRTTSDARVDVDFAVVAVVDGVDS
jgi:adenine-specific DNA-methyltransferase